MKVESHIKAGNTKEQVKCEVLVSKKKKKKPIVCVGLGEQFHMALTHFAIRTKGDLKNTQTVSYMRCGINFILI